MLTYDPVASLQHYPISGGMARFGLNPYQEPMYRVVFAPSRRYLVVGEWPDGSNCAQWVPKYKAVGNVWVMECWRSALQIHSLGKADWDARMLILGPWPERGDYEICHVFEACGPSDANIEKLVQWVEAGMQRSLYEKTAFARQEYADEREGIRQNAVDRIRNLLPAYGARPFASQRVRRVTPTPQLRSAEECGLPTTPGMRTRPNRPPRMIVAA